MLKILCDDKKKKRYLSSALLIPTTKLVVGINMGGKSSYSDIHVNSPAGVEQCLNRAARTKLLDGFSLTRLTEENDYPLIIKKKKKRANIIQDSLVVECRKEVKVFSNLFKEVILERIMLPKSEYIICSTTKKAFYIAKLIRKEEYKDVAIVPDDAYVIKTDISKGEPELQTALGDAPKIIKLIGLDFGTIKVGIVKGFYTVFSISPDLPLYDGMLEAFNIELTPIIEKKIELYNKIRTKQIAQI